MPYRTLAHGQVGTAELKAWVVTREWLATPQTFIIAFWNDTVYRSTNPPTTFTRARAQPDSFEFNEPVDEAIGEFGQAIYRTDHGIYLYDWEPDLQRWVLEMRVPAEELPPHEAY